MPRDTPVRIRAFSRARLPRVARSTLAEGGECTLLRTARTWEPPCPPRPALAQMSVALGSMAAEGWVGGWVEWKMDADG